MCIATVYSDDAGKLELLMQDVVSIESDENDMLLNTILGEKKLLKARIKYVDFLKHSVTVEAN